MNGTRAHTAPPSSSTSQHRLIRVFGWHGDPSRPFTIKQPHESVVVVVILLPPGCDSDWLNGCSADSSWLGGKQRLAEEWTGLVLK